uniref:BPL/LPL catalytic domain-containing protein n=1 Tax=Strigamia maritima TaxID=126957 RepID=T1J4N2_STRMM
MFLSFNVNRQMLNQALNQTVNDWRANMKNPFVILNSVVLRQHNKFRSLTNMALTKPPNILVYCKPADFIDVKKTILKVVNSDRYVVYHLQDSKILDGNIWADNVELLIVKKTKMETKIATQFLKYYENGGKVFSIDSAYFHRYFLDMNMRHVMNSIENEKPIKKLKKMYYKGQKVKLMCMQPQFVWNLEEDFEALVVDKLEKPLIFKKKFQETGGCFVSSLVDLEYDVERKIIPEEYYHDLKYFDESRLKILREILTGSLRIDCSPVQTLPLTPCYLVGDKPEINYFLQEIASKLKKNKLQLNLLTLVFHEKEKPNDSITSDHLPVIFNCDQLDEFSVDKYLSHLKSKQLTDHPRVIAVAKRQTKGKGRSGNDWLSPDGCAMFSVPLVFNLKSKLGKHPTWLQHLAALAMVEAVLKTPKYEARDKWDLDVRIKWPNDIYVGQTKMKIGGVVVTCTLIKDTFHCVIGCGFNVNNSVPTTCLNDLILRRNLTDPENFSLDPMTVEEVIAKVVSRLDELVWLFQSSGYESVVELYCRRWMHGGAEVSLQDGRKVQILGLDSNGFLTVLDNADDAFSTSNRGDVKSDSYRFLRTTYDRKNNNKNKEKVYETGVVNNDVFQAVLNHCFDDIEKFCARLQHVANAAQQLQIHRRNSHEKRKNKNVDFSFLALRATPPSEAEFIDIFQKLKLALNLIAKLKFRLRDPKAHHLVQYLLTPFILLAKVSKDKYYSTTMSSRAVAPLLTKDGIQMLTECLSKPEFELWSSMGLSWTATKDEWPGYVAPFYPIFYNGWAPDFPNIFTSTPVAPIRRRKEIADSL